MNCALGTTVQTCVLGPCVKPLSFRVYTTQSRPRQRRRASRAPDDRKWRLTEERLATAGARTERPEHHLRTWARASRALKGTCECGREQRAPRKNLVKGGRAARALEQLAATVVSLSHHERDFRTWARASRAPKETCERGRALRAP